MSGEGVCDANSRQTAILGTERPRLSLTSLPDDVLLVVFGLLDALTVVALTQVRSFIRSSCSLAGD